MIILFFCVFPLFSQAIEILDGNHAKDILQAKEPIEKQFQIARQQTIRIREFSDSNSTIGITILPSHPEDFTLCTVHGKTTLFADYASNSIRIVETASSSTKSSGSLKYKRDPDTPPLDDHYFLSMVNTVFGLVVVANNHSLYLFELNYQNNRLNSTKYQKYDFSNLRASTLDQKYPQLLYDDRQYRIYIVYQEAIYVGRFANGELSIKQTKARITTESDYLGKSILHNGYIFAAQGKHGVIVWKISYDGDLERFTNLRSDVNGELIIDVAIGGHDNNYLLALDKSKGIYIYNMTFDLDGGLSLQQISNAVDIPIIGGFLIRAKQRQLLVMVEHISYNFIQEYDLFLEKNQIIKLNTHELDQKYFDLQIADQFIMVKGYNAHEIIYHSIWSGFQSDRHEELTIEDWFDSTENETEPESETVIIPQLRDFLFIEGYFRKVVNGSEIVSVNLPNPYLVAITQQDLVLIQYYDVNPYVECSLGSNGNVGDSYTLQLELNSTWCEEKFQKILMDTSYNLYPNLIMCNRMEKLTLIVVDDYEQGGVLREHYAIAFVILLVLLMCIFQIAKRCIIRIQLKRVALQEQQKMLEKKGYGNNDSIEEVRGIE